MPVSSILARIRGLTTETSRAGITVRTVHAVFNIVASI